MTTGLDDLTRLAHEQACARLVTVYCNAYDARDYERLLAIFSDDAVWCRPVGKAMAGKAAMRAFLDARAPDILLRHHVSNILIDVDAAGLTASGESYGIVFRQHGFDGQLPAVLHQPELVVHYRHRFTRGAAGWRVQYHETNWIFKEPA